MVETAINSMLKELDPYTTYIPESDIEDFKFQTTGQYGGIGAVIRKKNDYVIIVEPYKGFPADISGLIAGDKLIEIGPNDVNLHRIYIKFECNEIIIPPQKPKVKT